MGGRCARDEANRPRNPKGQPMQEPMQEPMVEGATGIVSAADLERQLEGTRAATADARSGLFGPQSITWRVNRESALFLGAGRALLLQLAHPWVACAISQHSNTFANPVGRFHRTFRTVYAMVFGSLDQSMSAARRLHRRHEAITGTLPFTAGPFATGSPYCANAVPALRWVYATLTDTALQAHALVLPPLLPDERERHYAESRRFAALFGIAPAALPEDWSAFCAYMDGMVRSDTLTVTDSARQMAHLLLAGADSWLPVPASYRALTAALLPSRLRQAFDLPFGDAERRSAERLVAWVKRLYPILPSRLRFVGPYHEALQRIAGKSGPDLVTRMSNRFWIGRANLPT
jgi:uncharacterized protein (DUF2236 family)